MSYRGMRNPGPWRKVVKVGAYHPGGRNGGAYAYELECGHIAYRKASQGRPEKVRCDQCPTRLDTGSTRV